MMDLETFFTTVYVLVDDWYKEQIADMKPKVGAPAQMSDSEVLTVALVGQWRVGVPWQSERGLVRYMQAHGRGMFPTMLGKSAFNQRVRDLWGAFILLQQIVSELLDSARAVYECVDSLPLVAFSGGQALRQREHRLWQSTVGRGAGSWFWGDHLLAAVSRNEVVTGWLLGTAAINDRWLLEAFVSARAGQPQLVEPARETPAARAEQTPPPVGAIGPFQAVGFAQDRPYLADKGFNGKRWSSHWQTQYQATVITAPPDNTSQRWASRAKVWLASHRQIIETVFARLEGVFHIKHLNVHSRWGLYTRVAAIMAAYNIGLFINRLLGRPLGTLATLIC
jgi:hypothetical protein